MRKLSSKNIFLKEIPLGLCPRGISFIVYPSRFKHHHLTRAPNFQKITSSNIITATKESEGIIT
jgi:hypothetical protein